MPIETLTLLHQPNLVPSVAWLKHALFYADDVASIAPPERTWSSRLRELEAMRAWRPLTVDDLSTAGSDALVGEALRVVAAKPDLRQRVGRQADRVLTDKLPRLITEHLLERGNLNRDYGDPRRLVANNEMLIPVLIWLFARRLAEDVPGEALGNVSQGVAEAA